MDKNHDTEMWQSVQGHNRVACEHSTSHHMLLTVFTAAPLLKMWSSTGGGGKNSHLISSVFILFSTQVKVSCTK